VGHFVHRLTGAELGHRPLRQNFLTRGLRVTDDLLDSPNNLENIFSTIAKKHAGALIVSADSMFLSYRDRLAALAKQNAIPTIYFAREFVTAGGLISYSPSFVDSIRKAAAYVGRILKGEKAADLPVLQPTNFEIVINLKTAKALGLTVSPSLLARADEVIE